MEFSCRWRAFSTLFALFWANSQAEVLGPVTGDCTFETGVCFWKNVTCDDDDWLIHKGRTPSLDTGPSVDHTTNTVEGYFLYYDAGSVFSQLKKGRTAILESPNIKATPSWCTMKLWYHVFGNQTGSLLIYLKSYTGFRLLKEIVDDQGNVWLMTNVTLASFTDFRVHIIASRGDGERSDIAIDDITFSGCKFDNSTSNTYCSQALKTGCADGSREGFFSHASVAGCHGDWDGLRSLRDRPTRSRCGNKFDDGTSVKCVAPADVCDSANGWQVCGYGGVAGKIPGYIDGAACKTAGYGRFSAGINYCNRRLNACNKPRANIDYGCTHYDVDCDEPLCCGLWCTDQSNVTCAGAFWPGATSYTPLSVFSACSRLTSDDAGGVMCCYDKTFVPPTKPLGLCATCAFDNGVCGFYDENKNNFFNWTRSSGPTPGFNTGPDNDHTLGTSSGTNIYLILIFL
ncbi:MAM and LDL-receptor class A domain-containing protein 2-like isoform X2 [Oscarella lobularis]|uniref:MAM and LDL-receptor class A domain-containing protein 2-like isoform X2 n=1 Tax=Oscarella lobularis TaxID=121494 RepID=UPI003313D60C